MKPLSKLATPSAYSDRLIVRALKCLESRLRYGAEKINNSSDVKSYLQLRLADEPNEVFAVMFLTNSHRLLAYERIFNGTINEAAVYPRVIVQKAIKYNAAAVIVAHNHPSGNSEPSIGDKEVTRNLKRVLDIINVKLLDHIIVTYQYCYSFADHHLL
jgi:DNA repair protein RadC